MPVHSANLHPAIESRTLAYVDARGAFFSRVCNAALYLFLESTPEAQEDALQVVAAMKAQSRKATRRMSVQSRVREGVVA